MTSIEDKIVKLLFREEVVAKVMAEKLLPPITFSSEMKEDFTPERAYNLARTDLQRNLNRILND